MRINCNLLKCIKYEFIIKLYKQAKNHTGYFWRMLRNQLSFRKLINKKGEPSIYPALYKLYFMITQIVYKGKFFFMEDVQ